MYRSNDKKQLFLDRINTIASDIQTSGPNISDIMDCYIDLATASSKKMVGVAKNAHYKYIEDTYNRIMLGDPELLKARNGMDEIVFMSKIFNAKLSKKPNFFDEEETVEILELFQNMVKLGCYQVPVLKQDREIKKAIVSDCVSLAYYIWSRKQIDKTYQFDDYETFENLKNMYNVFKSTNPISIGNKVGLVYDNDGVEIIDTDRSDELLFASIDKFMKYIEKNYKYSSEEDSKTKLI